MNAAEAMTRPDAWVPVMGKTRAKRWRVGRSVNGSMQWHRGFTRYPASRPDPIITFAILANAEARAQALNLADAKASQRAEAKAVTP